MSIKQVRTMALAATLLAGTTALAYAQSNSMGGAGSPTKHNDSSSTQGADSPAANGKHESGASTTGAGGSSGDMKKGDDDKSTMKKGKDSKASEMKDGAPKSEAGKNAATKDDTGKGAASKNAEQNKAAPGANSKSTAEGGKSGGGANSANSTMGKSGTTGKADNAATTANGRGNVNLTTEQKTTIKNTVIENKSAPRVSHVDFNVNVGVVVPTTVHYAPLPDSIVEIHPAWRGYDYFVYEDQVIVIEPRSHKIVEIIVVS